MMHKLYYVFWGICFLYVAKSANAGVDNAAMPWKAGVARVVITPEEPIPMAGLADRDRTAEGKLHDLWAKALVLEDAAGKRCVFITLDLYGISKVLSDNIRSQLKLKYKLDKAQIIINSSHTHSGPVVSNFLTNAYDLGQEQIQKIETYTVSLSRQIIQLTGDAMKLMEPAQVYTANGLARTQVNRRNNNGSFLFLQPELRGPNDYAVPVIKVTGKSGNTIAIAFGYACHNNVLSDNQWSGDYAGYAQLELEKMYPGATALFFQGAGADQDPLPRGTVSRARQYGKEIAYAVEAVLSTSMKQQPPHLSFAYSEVHLSLNTPPAKGALELMTKDTTAAYKRRSAANLLQQINKGIMPIKSYPYPVQVWKIGEQSMFALSGELVIQYAIEIKKVFGSDTFVLGYSNDIMGYIPTAQILREANDKEEGYAFYDPANHDAVANEGGIFTQLVYGLPGTWASDIETIILNEAERVARIAGVERAVY